MLFLTIAVDDVFLQLVVSHFIMRFIASHTEHFMPSIFTHAQYLNLATYRKTGIRVDTPVWFAEEGDYLYVLSNNQAGKVKRLKNSSRCQIAPCTMIGKLTGEWHDSDAIILDNTADIQCAHQALQNKYGWQMRMLDAGARISGKIHQRSFLRIQAPK